jgi:hypothetical protein
MPGSPASTKKTFCKQLTVTLVSGRARVQQRHCAKVVIVPSYLTTSRFLLHWPMIGGFRLINLSGVNFGLDLVVLLQTAGVEGILDKKTKRHFNKPATGVLLCFVPLYASFLVIGARTLHRFRLRQLTQKRLDLPSFCTDSVTLRHSTVFK